MHDKKRTGTVGLVIVFALAAYFEAYFLAADHVDVVSNTPMYLLRYRVGSVSLHRIAPVFESARRLDDLCFQRRNAVVLDQATP